jgi:hypothetical protein
VACGGALAYYIITGHNRGEVLAEKPSLPLTFFIQQHRDKQNTSERTASFGQTRFTSHPITLHIQIVKQKKKKKLLIMPARVSFVSFPLLPDNQDQPQPISSQ